jgi:hypothetical protein|tara:strand:+ start:621 stop:923 length:303 start_codon:yes stop_codon:yes gene_type:complete
MTYDELTKRQKVYIDAVVQFGPSNGIDLNKTEFSRAELRLVSMSFKGKKWIPNWITHDQSRRAGRGIFTIPEVSDVAPGQETPADLEQDSVSETLMEIVQ